MLVAQAASNIFGVLFTKADGTDRRMSCRRGVKKGTRGVGLAFSPDEKGLVNVFDMNIGDFRFVNFATIREIQVDGVRYSVIG